MQPRTGEIIFLCAALAAIAGLYFAMAPPGLASNEEGVRYVQMKNFARNGSLEIAWPGYGLGFEAKDLAGQGGFFESRGGRLYAVAPPLFPWVASLFDPFLGDRTVDFVPILFMVLSALVLGATLDRVMQRGALYYLLLAAFLGGSPALLLAFNFSGQSLALALLVSGLFLLVRHFREENHHPAQLAGAAFLAGSAVLAGPEFLFAVVSFLIAAGVVFSIQKRWRDLALFAAGAGLALAVMVLHESVLHGGVPGSYLEMMLPYYAFSGIRCALFAGCVIASLALFAASRRENMTPGLRAIFAVLPVVLLLVTVSLTAARITVSHLMAVFPAVLFGFYGLPERMGRMMKKEDTLEAILAGTVILCLILGAVIQRPDLKRVLAVWLPLVPFVILLLGAEHRRIFDDSRGMYVVLLFFSGVALLNNLQEVRSNLWTYKDYNARRIEFLRQHTSSGDAVLFYDGASMEHAGPLFFERVFLVAARPGDQEGYTRRLAERGIVRAHAWSNDPFRDVRGFDPYAHESMRQFPMLPRRGSCCGGTCRERYFYLIRLDTGADRSSGNGRGGL
ncbi:MAG: hypothetical protein A4E73_02385 [Syntrophaceae bacterium PtaU1.Bin231]|nr:MAG: hypothetical protein A4E73_02385 [Syntrophaceae bacterium PtaU1.Bin231]